MKTYGRADDDRAHRRVGIADFAVTTDGALLTTSGLGSCLGIALRDDRAGVAGLAHVMLPTAPDEPSNAVKFTDTGIDALVRAMRQDGATVERTTAKLAGGSAMFDFDSQDEPIGDRNVTMARATLDRLGIPIAVEDVGGESGRSVRFHGDTGTLVVKSAGTERRM